MQGGQLNNDDRKFVKEAAHGGMQEVHLSKIAQERASSEQVKEFASRMIDDHTKAHQELMTLASSKGITLPSMESMDNPPPAGQTGTQDKAASDAMKKHHEIADHLSKQSGAEFDRAYMRQIVQDHEKMAALLERQSMRGTDAELKAFAAKILPTVREHLQTARTIANEGNAR